MKRVFNKPIGNLNYHIKNEITYRKHIEEGSLSEISEEKKKAFAESHKIVSVIRQSILPNRVELRVLHQLYQIYGSWTNYKEIFKEIKEDRPLSYPELYDIINKHLITTKKKKTISLLADALIEQIIKEGIVNEIQDNKGRFYIANLKFISGTPYIRTHKIAEVLNEDPKVVYRSLRSLLKKKVQPGYFINLIESKRSETAGRGPDIYSINTNGILLMNHLYKNYEIDHNLWQSLHQSCTNILLLIKLVRNQNSIVKESKIQFKRLKERINSIGGRPFYYWEKLIRADEVQYSDDIHQEMEETIRISDYVKGNSLLISSLSSELGEIESELKTYLKNFSRISDFNGLKDVLEKLDKVYKKYDNPISLHIPISLDDWGTENDLDTAPIRIKTLEIANLLPSVNDRLSYGYSVINRFENVLRENGML